MALTFAQGVTIIQKRIGDSSDSTAVGQALNQAQRVVARERRWPEMMVSGTFFNTVAAYSTGTVAVTNASTTVTLTSGTWPSDVATGAYRFQLGLTNPWYTVATRSSDSIILLAQAYVGDTATGQEYIVHKPQYSLASAVDRVEEVWLHDNGKAIPMENAATDQQVTSFLHYHSGPGIPTHYINHTRDSSGNRQLLLGPETPSAVRRVEYTYRKVTTDDTFSGNLDESRWHVVLALATALLYEPDSYERHVSAMNVYRRLLDEEWARTSEVETQHVRVGQNRISFPGRDVWPGNVLGFGTVEPS